MILGVLLSAFAIGRPLFAAMSSTSYRIQWDAVTTGGSDTSSSSSYSLRDQLSSGADTSGSLSSTSYTLDPGYRGGVYDPVVGFRMYTQDRSSQVAATASTSTTVTVTTTSPFSIGTYIATVQNEGASQMTAFGKITSIDGTVLTVDAFIGDSVAIDGSNDYAYAFTPDGTSLPLNTLSSSSVVTGLIAWEVTADVANGYDVYLYEDHDLQTASAQSITDVVDGAVTIGVTEYGARSSDTSLSSTTFDTQDTAITSTPQIVASRASALFAARDFVTLKVAMAEGQPDGSYGQTLNVLFAGNY